MDDRGKIVSVGARVLLVPRFLWGASRPPVSAVYIRDRRDRGAEAVFAWLFGGPQEV